MDEPQGLRARKKLAAMHRIQTVALELFAAEGFDAVTIERIAEASEVSPSSVYRYFGTKENVVVWDEYDDAALATVATALEQADPITVLRAVLHGGFADAVVEDGDRIRQRMDLVFSHPAIEAASALQAYEMARRIGRMLAASLDRDPDDLDVHVFAHALVGGMLGALRHWHATGYQTDPTTLVERPLAMLEQGLPLRASPSPTTGPSD